MYLIIAYLLILVLFILQFFILWKIFNYEQSRLAFFVWMQKAEKDLLKLKRSLTTKQAEVYTELECQECGSLLPENTARTHDGKRLCTSCKAKK